MQGKHGHLSREQKQLALRLHSKGWRLIDIAREIGCTAPMVGRMAREGRHLDGKPFGWEPREGHLTVFDREEILVGGSSQLRVWWAARRCLGRGRGLPRMGVLTLPTGKTSTCLTLHSPALT